MRGSRFVRRGWQLVDMPPEWIEILAGLQAIMLSIGVATMPAHRLPAYHQLIADTYGTIIPWVIVGAFGGILQVSAALVDDGRSRALIDLAMSAWWVLVAHEVSRSIGGSPASWVYVGIASQDALAAILLIIAGCLRLRR